MIMIKVLLNSRQNSLNKKLDYIDLDIDFSFSVITFRKVKYSYKIFFLVCCFFLYKIEKNLSVLFHIMAQARYKLINKYYNWKLYRSGKHFAKCCNRALKAIKHIFYLLNINSVGVKGFTLHILINPRCINLPVSTQHA